MSVNKKNCAGSHIYLYVSKIYFPINLWGKKHNLSQFSGLSCVTQTSCYHFEHVKKQVKTTCGKTRLEIIVPCSQKLVLVHKPQIFGYEFLHHTFYVVKPEAYYLLL